MPAQTCRLRLTPRPPRVWIVLLGGLLVPPVLAQQAPADQGDQRWVVTRTVHPRVAYRGPAPTANPPLAQAVLFPGGVFHQTLDASVAAPLDDEALDQRGSAGMAHGAGQTLGWANPTPDPAAAVGTLAGPRTLAPVGSGAAASGGAITRAMAPLAGTIQTALAPLAQGSKSGGGP